MRAELSATREIAREIAVKSADTFVVNWFSSACSGLFNGKAGTALHYTTGFDERSCQRYAAGHVRPPADFLRELLRSDQGATWLEVVMDGCGADWWRELQTARDLCSRYKIEHRP